MSKNKLIAVAIVCIAILVASIAIYFQLSQQSKNSWLALGDFVVYQQNFVWTGGYVTTYMFWNVTGLNGNTADIQLVSHGVNTSNGTVSIPSTEIELEVDTKTRQILGSSIIQSEMSVGSKFPFWIPQSVKVGDPIQTSYGDSTISPSQTLQIMGQGRDCWVVAYAYSPGNNMNRYYDTATGICLLIQSHILSNGVSVAINETAVQTDIKSISS
jgi:hypothetical protein